ncbi:MAG: FAD/NAD(P)-binding protein [Deltaproteobacteria bacterium]|nr:FAD/NAD(P)-binding protein [Deltaproteobacteria bacterium]
MSLSANQEKSGLKSPYLPVSVVIERVTRLTEHERLFRIKPSEGLISFDPGQFFMAGLPGFGEGPFSVASCNQAEHGFELCIRAVGNLTNALHRLKRGDTLWLRGPFGRGFDLKAMKAKDILFIAGGIGIVPMRGLIQAILADRASYGRLNLIYGSKTADALLFKDEAILWQAAGVDVAVTIDAPCQGWNGRVGVVTTCIPPLDLVPARTTAVIIGPPVMYKFVVLSLWEKRIPRDSILVSLERRMKCGLGKCGHCQINSSYVCQEGPVYKLTELKNLYEAFL